MKKNSIAKNMAIRIGVASLILSIIGIFLFLLRQKSLYFADAVILVFAAIGTYEIVSAFKKEYNVMFSPAILNLIIVFPLYYFLSAAGILISLIISTMLALVIFTFKHEKSLNDLFVSIFTLIYPTIILALAILLNHSAYGLISICFLILNPVLTDTMAYFVGISIGKRKLCPSISPKKTIAGAVGGLIGGLLSGVIIFLIFDKYNIFKSFANLGKSFLFENQYLSLAIYLIIGLLGAIAAELGDLAASWIKRNAGIKDFGKIFPGHGGVIDRIDSILFVIPIIFVIISICERFS